MCRGIYFLNVVQNLTRKMYKVQGLKKQEGGVKKNQSAFLSCIYTKFFQRNYTPKSNNSKFYQSSSAHFGYLSNSHNSNRSNGANKNNFSDKRNNFLGHEQYYRKQRDSSLPKNVNEPWEHDKFEEIIKEEKAKAVSETNPHLSSNESSINNKRLIVKNLEEHLSDDENKEFKDSEL